MSSAAVPSKSTHVSSLRQPLLTNEAWAIIAPLLPAAMATGRPRKWALRHLLEAILYLLRTGCQWRALPNAFPPYSTVQRHFYKWRDAGLFERINHFLVMYDRERGGREASPSAAIIDCQSVKTSETGGTKGYDGGKKLVGLKRHILVDADGRLLAACISPAHMHDSRAATQIHVIIVTGPPNQRGFIVQKRRWVVERTLAWIGRNRRLAKDYERQASTALTFVFIAAAWILMPRIGVDR